MTRLAHTPLAALALIALGSSATAQDAATATAEMQLADGTPAGLVELTETPHGVLLNASLTELPVGEHGFHIHETGACAPDFGAAGGHFNPGDMAHGFENPDGPHAGDMPNVVALAEGAAAAQVFNTRVSLTGENALMDDDGAAIIVHELPDSYGAEAGAGGRIACGEITLD